MNALRLGRLQAVGPDEGGADQADGAVARLGQDIRHQPVQAVDLVLPVIAEVVPLLEQAQSVGPDHGDDDAVGARRDAGEDRAVVRRPDRRPEDLGDLAPGLLERGERSPDRLVRKRVVVADGRDVLAAPLAGEPFPERLRRLAGGGARADDRRHPLPLGDLVGAGDGHEHGHAGLAAHLGDGRPLVAAQRADEEVHLLGVHQTPRVVQGIVGVAGGVRDDDAHRPPRHLVALLLPEQLVPAHGVLARLGERPGEGRQEADADLLLRAGQGHDGADHGEDDGGGESSHGVLLGGATRSGADIPRADAAGKARQGPVVHQFEIRPG